MTEAKVEQAGIIRSREGDISFYELGCLLTERVRDNHSQIDETFGFAPSLDVYLRGVFTQAIRNGELVALTPLTGTHASWFDSDKEPPIDRQFIHHFYARAESIKAYIKSLKDTDPYVAQHFDEIIKAIDDISNAKASRQIPPGTISLKKSSLRLQTSRHMSTAQGRNIARQIGLDPQLLTRMATAISESDGIDSSVRPGTHMKLAAVATEEGRAKRNQLYENGL